MDRLGARGVTRQGQFAADSELDRAIAAFEYDHIAAYDLLRGGDRTRADGMFVAGRRTVPHEVEEGICYAELARRMDAPRSVVTRITNPFYFGHTSRTLRSVAEARPPSPRLDRQAERP